MAFAGVKDDIKIADIIAYLSQFAADGTKTQ
jgi:cytochrome c2